MPKLGVNLDHVATLRQARKGREPDPAWAAAEAQIAGADSLVMHLREDRRHMQDRDFRLIRQMTVVPLNLEMAANQEMMKFALEEKPDLVTLVPERREELTTEGGLEVALNPESFRKFIRLLKDAEIEVSLFINPDLDQVKASHRVDADRVELHTGRYSELRSPAEVTAELQKIVNAAKMARKLGLKVSAGHGLNYQNVGTVAALPEIEELNIGHSILSRAVFVGLRQALREMKHLIDRGETSRLLG